MICTGSQLEPVKNSKYRIFNADRVPNYLSDLFYKDYSHSSRRSGFLNFVQPLIRNTFGSRMFLAMVLFYGTSYLPVLSEQTV